MKKILKNFRLPFQILKTLIRENFYYGFKLVTNILITIARCGILLVLYWYVYRLNNGVINGTTFLFAAWSIFFYFAFFADECPDLGSFAIVGAGAHYHDHQFVVMDGIDDTILVAQAHPIGHCGSPNTSSNERVSPVCASVCACLKDSPKPGEDNRPSVSIKLSYSASDISTASPWR